MEAHWLARHERNPGRRYTEILTDKGKKSATLHLLRLEDRLVDVTFFDRLYGRAQVGLRGYGTFTQQFKPIFDDVQRNLVRKGVLIIDEAKTMSPQKPDPSGALCLLAARSRRMASTRSTLRVP